jgi:tetratricopeptide (TPR) repeat protein
MSFGALKLRPIPFDEAMIKAVQAYAVLKSGDIEAGTAQLTTAIAWFDRSSLRYTRSIVALWLAEAWLRKGELLSARETAEQVMATSREFGYKHAQGVAARLIGESLLKQDAESAARYLDDALAILEAAGARNDIAKTRVTRAEALRAAGDSAGARALLALARAEFERLGTLDIPPQLAALTTD